MPKVNVGVEDAPQKESRNEAEKQQQAQIPANLAERSQELMEKLFGFDKSERNKFLNEIWKAQMAAKGITEHAGAMDWVDPLLNVYSEVLPQKTPNLWALIVAGKHLEECKRIVTNHLRKILYEAIGDDGVVDLNKVEFE